MSEAQRNRLGAAPFCHVEKRGDGRSRHYIVHGEAPRFVAEIEAVAAAPGEKRRGVIRRVVAPNSWSGDYHKSGKLLGAALAFFESDPAGAGREGQA
ncbi:MAG: hypothetical protein ACREIA_01505 [Opitutaceae bacterium]